MLLSNIIMEDSEKDEPGTYVAGYFSKESQDKIFALAKKLGIPNLVPKDKYHVTIIFSKKTISYKGLGEMKEPWEVTAEKFHVFPTQSDKKCLVLKLDAPDLIHQHKKIMKKYKEATYSFDEYIPHCTLSYDIDTDFKLPDNSELDVLGDLEIIEEISEPINNDFVASL